MDLGLSKEEIIDEWNKSVESTTPSGQAAARAALRQGGKAAVMHVPGSPAPTDDLQLAMVSFVNNVVRLNNRRILEQLKRAGIRIE